MSLLGKRGAPQGAFAVPSKRQQYVPVTDHSKRKREHQGNKKRPRLQEREHYTQGTSKRKHEQSDDREAKRAKQMVVQLERQKDECEQRFQLLRAQMQQMRTVAQSRIRTIVQDKHQIEQLQRQLTDLLNRMGLYQQQVQRLNAEYEQRLRTLRKENDVYKARMALVNRPKLHY